MSGVLDTIRVEGVRVRVRRRSCKEARLSMALQENWPLSLS